MRVLSACIAVIVLADGAWGAGVKDAPAGNPFAGKFILISARSKPDDGIPMKEAEIKQIGEQRFVVGKGVDTGLPGAWFKDRIIWMNLGDTSRIVEFATLDDLKKAMSPAAVPVAPGGRFVPVPAREVPPPPS